MIHGIPGAEIRKYSRFLTPYLQEFTGNGQWHVEDLLDHIESRERQCWLVMKENSPRAVALTQISDDRLSTCRITNVTGTGLREWSDAYLEVESWARSIGSARLEALARPGYERVGKPYGLRKTHVLLEKDL